MKLDAGEDIGEETHDHVEQVLAITSNSGMSVLDGVERPIKAGDIVIVPAGVKHNIKNGPGAAMKIKRGSALAITEERMAIHGLVPSLAEGGKIAVIRGWGEMPR